MAALFGGGGRSRTPAPVPQPARPAPTGITPAQRERQRRIGRAALIKSDQENFLAPTTGRNVLTAV